MPTFRRERMAEAIRKVVTEKISREQPYAKNVLVTVNRVDVAKDFGVARIYYSIFGGDLAHEEKINLMCDQRSEFRFEISRKLNLRRTPKIEFCYDQNTEYAFKIDAMLKHENNSQ